MKRVSFGFAVVAVVVLLVAGGCWWLECGASVVPDVQAAELRPGGDTTVSIEPLASFILPAANLDVAKKPNFYAGKSLAEFPWVIAPSSTTARDGLGPLYNQRACLDCHINGGRGRMPDSDHSTLFAGVLRLSVPGDNAVLGVVPEPTYGTQFQSQSTSLVHQLGLDASEHPSVGSLPPEGQVHISWVTQTFRYPDGGEVELRKPNITLSELGYGPLQPNTLKSLRIAPPLVGMGLLEMVKQSDIDKLADPKDRNHDGISGRINMAWDFETHKPSPGRFGYKANIASVRTQVAAAMHSDLGISNPIFPTQPCTRKETACLKRPTGDSRGGHELPENLLHLLVRFTMEVGVPERRKPTHPKVLRGRKLFYLSGCAGCHHPSFTTGVSADYPALSEQTIWPYSDLLIHDMGPGLSDGRPDYQASGREWRTAPLWGVGLSQAVNGSGNYLHDGRARTLEEAILWHGGEAKQSRSQFAHLGQEDREALISFVRSL